ncbi:hypothetical protein DM860_010392 [Cuscuta australis]|uniref:DYW domain-containing protein n=1 Tax=Cuscuta australis TaxID=267555 RepID=A0A328E0Y7_9ASTE|nr:hypothetical protein DM860_010392 [Cuscuta australis]
MAAGIHPPATIFSASTAFLPATTLNSHFLFQHHQLPPISPLSVVKPKQKLNRISIQQPLSRSDPPSNSSVSGHSDPQAIDWADLLKLAVRRGDVEVTRVVHGAVLKLEEDTRLSNALISAYLKLGFVNHAHNVFGSIPDPDVKSYTAMISGFAKSNLETEAMELFSEMRSLGIEPNDITLVALLTACIRSQNLELGRQVHGLAIKLCYLDCIHLVNGLMGLYGKCGRLDFVIKLFHSLSKRDIASWNTVISCLVKESMYDTAFDVFIDMQETDSLRADYITLSTLLIACFECLAIRKGQVLHAHALRIGYEGSVSVNNALIKFYTKCGNISSVMALFEKMCVEDEFTWNEMITAYMEAGLVDSAEKLFNQLPKKNAVLYNALLAGFCRNGEGLKAMTLFHKMTHETLEVSGFTLVSVANACGLMMDRKSSEQIHGFILKSGFLRSNDHVQSALLDMCVRCGRMEDAEKMFHRLPPEHDRLISFTSMVWAYAHSGRPEEAVSLFCEMISEGLSPVIDDVSSATILGVCGTLGLHNLGRNLHCHSLKLGFLSDVTVGNAIISMYAKCGELGGAVKTFELMTAHDLVSWNNLLAGYVLHRQGNEALDTWARMKMQGVTPDSFTCLLILSSYRHTTTNLVNLCRNFFSSIRPIYSIVPGPEHYACLVSVLGFWGLLQDAEEIIKRMPFEPNASVWRALLDSCRIHSDSTTGRRAMKEILSLEPHDPATFILNSNLYSASGRWNCSELVRAEMKDKGFQKIPGQSWINHDNKLHSFLARDRLHPQSKDINSGLRILLLECMKVGYVPDTRCVLHDVEEYQKKEFLFYHSSKLAVTCGLLMTKPGKPVFVVKNILLCRDCHTFFKFVSVVTKREIRVRDRSGFHCFVNGKCTCNDRW